MIKNFLLAIVALTTSLTGVVLANSAAQASKEFEGIFIGVNAGHSSGKSKVSHSLYLSPVLGNTSLQNTLGTSGIEGGIHLGYNHRINNIVLGLEGVYNFPKINGNHNLNLNNVINSHESIKMLRNFQVRANLSYVICNIVAPKVIVGWHNSHWKRNNNFYSLNKETVSTNHNSFMWGVGADFIVYKNWMAGIEYTSILGAKKKSTIHAGHETSFTPAHNKFALVFKFIY
jgi:opacity protein-like surface antigen